MHTNLGRTLKSGTTHQSSRNFGTSTRRGTDESAMDFLHHNRYIMGLKNIVNGLISPANNFDLCSRDLQRRKFASNTMAGIANEIMPTRPQTEGRLKTAILGLDICNTPQSQHMGLNDQCMSNKYADVVAIHTSEEFPELREAETTHWQPKQDANCSNIEDKVGTFKDMSCSKQNPECDSSEDGFVVFANSDSPKCSSSMRNYMPEICSRIRQRQISECSDDSFVICFTEDAPEGVIDVLTDNESDTEPESETDSTSDDNDDEDDDEDIFEEESRDQADGIPHFVQKTDNCYFNSGVTSQPDSGFDEQKPVKRVRFNLKPEVHVMHVWNFAYRASRKGQWDMYARDRDRFQRRIQSLAEVLNPVLNNKHRERIYQTRFCDKTNLNQLEPLERNDTKT